MFKWTIQSLLADANLMKFHFIARQKKNSNREHLLIGTSTRKTLDIVKETSLNIQQAWGNLLFLVEKIRTFNIGTYLLLRSGDNQGIRIYDIPQDLKTVVLEEEREDDN